MCVSLPAQALSVSARVKQHTQTADDSLHACFLRAALHVSPVHPDLNRLERCDLAYFLSSAERIAVFGKIGDVMA